MSDFDWPKTICFGLFALILFIATCSAWMENAGLGLIVTLVTAIFIVMGCTFLYGEPYR